MTRKTVVELNGREITNPFARGGLNFLGVLVALGAIFIAIGSIVFAVAIIGLLVILSPLLFIIHVILIIMGRRGFVIYEGKGYSIDITSDAFRRRDN